MRRYFFLLLLMTGVVSVLACTDQMDENSNQSLSEALPDFNTPAAVVKPVPKAFPPIQEPEPMPERSPASVIKPIKQADKMNTPDYVERSSSSESEVEEAYAISGEIAGLESLSAGESSPPAASNGHLGDNESNSSSSLEAYEAKLSADKEIKLPGTGRMKVWVGDPAYMPENIEGMVSDTTMVPTVGESVKVYPYAPDFELDRKESDCMALHPQGSEEIFSLTPKATGLFNVGAKIKLYPSGDCSGVGISRVVSEMQVKVKVNMADPVKQAFVEEFRDWIIWVIGAFFAVLALLLRKKIKKWFGIDVDAS